MVSGTCLGSLLDRPPSLQPPAGLCRSLFGAFVGTTQSWDSPAACMKDTSLLAFSLRPAVFTQRAPLGSPGSRALSFQTCLGSSGWLRMTRGQDGSLHLSCTALSSATPCRFIPAHQAEACPTHAADLGPFAALRWRYDAHLDIPRRGGPDRVVHRIDIAHAFPLQPFLQALGALFGVDRNPFLPGGAPA